MNKKKCFVKTDLKTKVSKMANTSHRSGALKQSNKNHKTGKHRSKGAVDAVNR